MRLVLASSWSTLGSTPSMAINRTRRPLETTARATCAARPGSLGAVRMSTAAAPANATRAAATVIFQEEEKEEKEEDEEGEEEEVSCGDVPGASPLPRRARMTANEA